ncbi:MAG: tetratricopeptide repeat protein [Pseudomonadota bacterium]|nr:tetratricopeptide repeat protein [Pseudomonadota bacterium]
MQTNRSLASAQFDQWVRRAWFSLYGLILVMTLSACSTIMTPNEPESMVDKKPSPAALIVPAISSEDEPIRPFDEQTLLNLLIAEFAIYDQNLRLATDKYLHEAYATQDPDIAAYATRLAIYANNKKAALSAAQLWHQLSPEALNAGNIFADLLIQSGEALHGLTILAKYLETENEGSFNRLNQLNLAAGETQLNQLINAMQDLVEKHPEHFELTFSLVVLLQKNQQADQALKLLTQLPKNDQQVTKVITKSTELIHQLKGPSEAADYLRQQIKKTGAQFTLQHYQAKLLSQFNLPAAEKAFSQLLETHNSDASLLYSHAIIAFENGNITAAKKSFEQLQIIEQHINASYYYLGRIAQQEQELSEAEHFFRQVGNGTFFMPATKQLVKLQASNGNIEKARAYLTSLRKTTPNKAAQFWALEAELLRINGQTSTAYKVLSQAVISLPENLILRIERALLSERLNNFTSTEKDLRFVLNRDPQNVVALNALGYMLTNNSSRFEEALALINQAITLRPNDGAIIDSLGWVQYHLGDWHAAIQNLERAFEILPDDEVAAHLIEVYWQNGDQYKARRLIRQLKKIDTPMPQTNDIIKKLDIR